MDKYIRVIKMGRFPGEEYIIPFDLVEAFMEGGQEFEGTFAKYRANYHVKLYAKESELEGEKSAYQKAFCKAVCEDIRNDEGIIK